MALLLKSVLRFVKPASMLSWVESKKFGNKCRQSVIAVLSVNQHRGNIIFAAVRFECFVTEMRMIIVIVYRH